MASAPVDYVPTLNERLDFLRKASNTVISALVDSIPELWTCLPQDYLRELGASNNTIGLQSSLVCWAVSQGRIVPREMQLRLILADQRGRDSLISAGTGSGKTLPIALCTLLDDPAKKKVTIVVSPLKRLQKSQANEFTMHFGIRAVGNRAFLASSVSFRCFAARDNKGRLSIVASVFIRLSMLGSNRKGCRQGHFI